MLLNLASLILSVGWVLWAVVYASHARRVPAAWTRIAVLSTLSTAAVVFSFCFGFGTVFAALVTPGGIVSGLGTDTILETLGAPVVAAFVASRLRRMLMGSESGPSFDADSTS